MKKILHRHSGMSLGTLLSYKCPECGESLPQPGSREMEEAGKCMRSILQIDEIMNRPIVDPILKSQIRSQVFEIEAKDWKKRWSLQGVIVAGDLSAQLSKVYPKDAEQYADEHTRLQAEGEAAREEITKQRDDLRNAIWKLREEELLEEEAKFEAELEAESQRYKEARQKIVNMFRNGEQRLLGLQADL